MWRNALTPPPMNAMESMMIVMAKPMVGLFAPSEKWRKKHARGAAETRLAHVHHPALGALGRNALEMCALQAKFKMNRIPVVIAEHARAPEPAQEDVPGGVGHHGVRARVKAPVHRVRSRPVTRKDVNNGLAPPRANGAHANSPPAQNVRGTRGVISTVAEEVSGNSVPPPASGTNASRVMNRRAMEPAHE